jgi:hypothetical protein
MIKLRLHGVEEELLQYVEEMRKKKSVKILSESDVYKDRGKSEYVRIYLDVEMKVKK